MLWIYLKILNIHNHNRSRSKRVLLRYDYAIMRINICRVHSTFACEWIIAAIWWAWAKANTQHSTQLHLYLNIIYELFLSIHFLIFRHGYKQILVNTRSLYEYIDTIRRYDDVIHVRIPAIITPLHHIKYHRKVSKLLFFSFHSLI